MKYALIIDFDRPFNGLPLPCVIPFETEAEAVEFAAAEIRKQPRYAESKAPDAILLDNFQYQLGTMEYFHIRPVHTAESLTR